MPRSLTSLAILAGLAAAGHAVVAVAQTPNYPPPAQAERSITPEPSNEYYPYFLGKVDKDNGFATNLTNALPTTNTYSVAGPINITDKKAMLACTAACTMTLAAGTIDGVQIVIKRAPGSAASTIAANIDGTAQSIALNASGAGSYIKIRWDAQLNTYDTE